MLKVSKKNNWWTKEEDKKNISLETKLEYLLSSGSVSELKQVGKQYGIGKLKEIYKDKLKKNIFLKGKRHLLLNFFFDAN